VKLDLSPRPLSARRRSYIILSQQGYTAIRITEMNEDFNRQHQDIRKENGVDYGDLPDFADYDYIQKVARMNLSVLANLATCTIRAAKCRHHNQRID
jgi:hypothetical protein